MAESHTIAEIRRLRQALEATIHILHFAEESIPSQDACRRVREARQRAQREYDQNKLHYDSDIDAAL